MNYLFFIFRSTLQDFNRNKLRSFLTSLGILIGVSSVVLLLSFGLGFKKYLEDMFESLGSNLVIILPGGMVQGGRLSMGPGTFAGIRFDGKDVVKLKRVKNTLAVMPVNEVSDDLSARGETVSSQVIISNAEVFKGLNLEIDEGELFDKSDVDRKNKTVVLGPKIAVSLFGNVSGAVGEEVKIGDQNFRVAGVVKAKGGGSMGEPSIDEHVYIPHTAASGIAPEDKFIGVYIKVSDKDKVEEVIRDIKTELLKRYKEDEFSVMQQTEVIGAVTSIITMINSILIAIAGISLIVGGVGIMNIMYISVAERINEIGLRRAVGATKNDILMLFLSSGIILSLIGGILGLSVSFCIVTLIHPYFPAYIDLNSVLLAIGFSGGIGIIFGIIPARKAANLTPIDAIRHEEG